MNNYCRNCGKKIPENSKKCPECQVEIINKRVDFSKKEEEFKKFKNKERIYVIISIFLFLIGVFCFFKNSNISYLFFITTLVLLITFAIELKNSVIINVLLYTYLGVIASFIFYMIYIISLCTGMMR